MTRSDRASSARVAAWLGSVLQDLRYALRSLAGQPAFTTMAVLALVLGIGLNTSVFTVINSLLTRPWDVPEPDRVVNVHDIQWFGLATTAARYLDENSQTVEGVLASRAYRAELGGEEANAVSRAAFVTANFFEVLQIGMALGRGFLPDEDVAGAPVTVGVISYALWAREYGANPDVVGTTVRLEGVPFTVVGVAAESFGGVDAERTDLWVPLAAYPVVRASDPTAMTLLTDPHRCCVGVSARLKAGVSRSEAQAELATLFRQYSAAIPAPAFERPPGRNSVDGHRGAGRPGAAAAAGACIGRRGRCLRLDTAARVRQRQQSAARARHVAPARNRRAHGARREPVACSPSASDRKLAACGPRERGRARARDLAARHRAAVRRQYRSRQRACVAGPASAGVWDRRSARQRTRVRLAAGAAQHGHERKRRAEAAKRAGEPTCTPARRAARHSSCDQRAAAAGCGPARARRGSRPLARLGLRHRRGDGPARDAAAKHVRSRA